MADKIISTIKISNNDTDKFVVKSIDTDKVSELYNEVFGDTNNNGLKKHILALENEINILKQKVDSLYNGENYSNKDDSFDSLNI